MISIFKIQGVAEDVIATVGDTNNNFIELNEPMYMVDTPQGLRLSDWLIYSAFTAVSIPLDKIIAEFPPTESVASYYKVTKEVNARAKPVVQKTVDQTTDYSHELIEAMDQAEAQGPDFDASDIYPSDEMDDIFALQSESAKKPTLQ